MDDVLEALVLLFVCLVVHAVQQHPLSLGAGEGKRSKRCQHFFAGLHARRRARRKMLLGILPKPRKSPVVWAKERNTEWWQQTVLGSFSEIDWLENFRMRSSTFFYVVSELQPLLERQKTSFRDPVSVEKQVAIALWRFATNLEYRRIGEQFGVSCTTVYHCIHDVCQAINKVLKPQFLRQPTEAEFQSTAQGFEELSGLPMCIGAITCTHIPIMGPEVNYFDYYNSNGWHSVSLQGITDHTGKFWDVSVGHPGRAHSARILRISGVWQRATSGHLFHSVSREVCGLQVGYSLAGDCAYPLKPWLLRPYSDREPLSPARQEFNQRVGRAHRVALEALARLKGRWRCLLKRNDCQLWRLSNLMKACCVLHNICETHGDRFFPDWLTIDRGDFPQPVCRLQDQAEEGVEALRTAICEHIQQAPCESLALQTCNL